MAGPATPARFNSGPPIQETDDDHRPRYVGNPDRPWEDPRALGIYTSPEERAIMRPQINPNDVFRLGPVKQPHFPTVEERLARIRRRQRLW
jgi:hypothetical protein